MLPSHRSRVLPFGSWYSCCDGFCRIVSSLIDSDREGFSSSTKGQWAGPPEYVIYAYRWAAGEQFAIQDEFMQKILGRATSGVLSYLRDCVGTHITFSGSGRLCPLYLKLSDMLRKLQDWRSRSRKTSEAEHEGLGAVYDRRKWMESYYGKHSS